MRILEEAWPGEVVTPIEVTIVDNISNKVSIFGLGMP